MAVWRKLTWLRYVAFAEVLGWLAFGVFQFALPGGSPAMFAFWLLWGISMMAFEVLVRRINRRTRDVVWEWAFKMCTQCGYHLAGLPSEHVCPECGNQYTAADLECEWRKWYS